MNVSSVIPVFRMFDETKAREFYLDFLGFGLAFEHRFSADAPLYLGLTFGGADLHLSEHHGDASPGGRVRIEIDDIESYHNDLTSKRYKYGGPGLETAPWGFREVSVRDPFHNTIVFCQPDASIVEQRKNRPES